MGYLWPDLRRRLGLGHLKLGQRFQLWRGFLGDVRLCLLCQPLPNARLHSELCRADADGNAYFCADPVERAHDSAPDAAALASPDTLANARTNVGSYALANAPTNVGSYALANASANVGS